MIDISWLKRYTRQFRYERKFVISELDRYGVESIIRCHPVSFSEIFHERPINNIYFDSLNMASYLDNECGMSQRLKVRIRWYGSLFEIIEKPMLELKIKDGQLGSKISFPLVPFRLDTGFSSRSIADVFRRSDIPEILKEALMFAQPTLLIRYLRKYFQSVDRKYRLTLDWDMQYYMVDKVHNTFGKKRLDRLNTVLELKYSDGNDDKAHTIINYFPFRLSRNSKYMVGIDSLSCFR